MVEYLVSMMRRRSLLLFLLVSSAPFCFAGDADLYPKLPCEAPVYNSFAFCDTSLPIANRARALVSLLTLQEKIQQLSNTAAAVPRLGLPAFEWWSESLHGIASNGPGVAFYGSVRAATEFPQVILSAAAYNRTLWGAMARAIAVEARAMYNVGQAGLTYWAPNINIFRDPRWGRGQETPGEDPLLAAEFAVEYVKGLQGEYDTGDADGSSLMLSACCKHYTAYDLDRWDNYTRYIFNAQVNEQDMEDTYQPPFESCVKEGHASCLMCAYNQVNGVPACARADLLDKARKEWGFKGYVTSDCDAVGIIYEDQKYTSSPEDSIADVLKAGMDINCGTYLPRHTESAIRSGKAQEEDIDRALLNLFSVQLRLGIFDGKGAKKQYGHLGPDNLCTKEHRDLALEAVRQGIVLLKNAKDFLPLRKHEVNSVAIIGPGGTDTTVYGGDYTGIPCNPTSILEGIRSYVPRATFAAGCIDVPCQTMDGFDEAFAIAKDAEIVVVVAGLNLTEETEDLDRYSLLLPGKQMELIRAIGNISKKPLILVLTGGGPIDVSFAKEDPLVSSILWLGYPGEVGGQALAEVLFGDVNPGGRLPVMWYPESFTRIPMTDMNMRADPSRDYPGRTYRFYTGKQVYDFGYGLSYSKYSYKFLYVPEKITVSQSSAKDHIKSKPPHIVATKVVSTCEDVKFHVKISVFNNGHMEGSHTVLLFYRPKTSIRGAPRKQLIGFERARIRANEAAEVDILVDPCKHFSFADVQGQRILPLGTHVLMLEDLERELVIETEEFSVQNKKIEDKVDEKQLKKSHEEL
ncbi:probable beta-D-xylosidase 6 [Zingiber officinale]|uniref:probable beta-D-xylosidase 6 n=1 Tax=Zingiber officinale TaxID=94328 RepID=UPI001C4C5CF3|nr:probable beta-D-xylosidase 6 [Zingiber officinale]